MRKARSASIGKLDDFRFIHSAASTLAGAFTEITDERARGFYKALGMDPDSE
jgi:hypothetical protein